MSSSSLLFSYSSSWLSAILLLAISVDEQSWQLWASSSSSSSVKSLSSSFPSPGVKKTLSRNKSRSFRSSINSLRRIWFRRISSLLVIFGFSAVFMVSLDSMMVVFVPSSSLVTVASVGCCCCFSDDICWFGAFELSSPVSGTVVAVVDCWSPSLDETRLLIFSSSPCSSSWSPAISTLPS